KRSALKVFLKPNRSDFMLVCQHIRQQAPIRLSFSQECGRPVRLSALCLPRKWGEIVWSGETPPLPGANRQATPNADEPPKTEGPEIRPFRYRHCALGTGGPPPPSAGGAAGWPPPRSVSSNPPEGWLTGGAPGVEAGVGPEFSMIDRGLRSKPARIES